MQLNKGLAHLVTVLFSGLALSISNPSYASNSNSTVAQASGTLTQAENDLCRKYALAIVDSLGWLRYSEEQWQVAYGFASLELGRCVAKNFNKLAPPQYYIEEINGEFWLMRRSTNLAQVKPLIDKNLDLLPYPEISASISTFFHAFSEILPCFHIQLLAVWRRIFSC